jgi:hypothetical protein
LDIRILSTPAGKLAVWVSLVSSFASLRLIYKIEIIKNPRVLRRYEGRYLNPQGKN